jgi:hypothetical protein
MNTITQARPSSNPYAPIDAVSSNTEPAVAAESEALHNSTLLGSTVSPDFSGDLEARVAAMVINHATSNRIRATEQRAAQEKQLAAAEERQVSQMHHSADLMREQAWVDLAMNTGAAAASAASACTSGKTSAGLKGTGEAIGVATKFVDRQYSSTLKEIDIRQTEAQHSMDAAKRRLETINDSKKGADNLEDRAINFLTTATQQRADTERAMIFRG